MTAIRALNRAIIIVSLLLSVSLQCAEMDTQSKTSLINQYISTNKESLSYVDVVKLASSVIHQRELYSNDTIAKVFVLLADAAINRGDAASAFKFAQDGLALKGLGNTLQLNLLQKLTQGYYVQGKYHQVQKTAQQMLVLAESNQFIQQKMIALSYQSMAYALGGKQDLALSDLQQVELLMAKHQKFSDHTVLLDVLALAHYYLGDYQVALNLYNKLLKLKFESNNTYNIEVTYYNLARTYRQLNILDDAYNAYWEAKAYAEKKSAPILIAYAQLGLGDVLIAQEHFEEAFDLLLPAEKIFHAQHLTKPYLTTLIALAKSSLNTNRREFAHQLLSKAEVIAENVELIKEQTALYLLLAQMHESNNNFKKAYHAQLTYSNFHQQVNFSKHDIELSTSILTDENSKFVVDMVTENELKSTFTKKLVRQKKIVLILVVVLALLLIALTYLWLKVRYLRLNRVFDEMEKPVDMLATPAQTKRLYQSHYKMARKYEYPLAIAYLSVTNWKELVFHFNKKVIAEVVKTIATLINENIGEFDYAGMINDGEYLVLCPHQTCFELQEKLTLLTNELQVRFFANLGEFSVKINYSLDSPTAQDIDPYIFLSRLSDSMQEDFGQYKKS